MADYLVTIGLEIHAQVLTRSKMFDGCPAEYANMLPNTHVSVVSLGLPGSLPVINERAIALAALSGLAINCRVNHESVFARKSYIYPDLPKGYQITQYDKPLCSDGWLEIRTEAGETKRIGIERLHMEEDTGRNVHIGNGTSLVDLNRSGVPLMEIVSNPDMTTPEEARLYFEKLHQTLVWIGVNTGSMADGAMRCDANVSIRPEGQQEYGVKVEIKNLNSFRAIERALTYEVQRQIAVLKDGGTLTQETRGWNEEQGVTVAQRSKEFAQDYRYFPDPDLPPLVLDDAWIAARQSELPELPDACCQRFMTDYGLSRKEAELLTTNRAVADYYETAVAAAQQGGSSARDVANWIVGELFRLLKEEAVPFTALADRMPAGYIAEVLDMLTKGTINRTVAKQVFEESFHQTTSPIQLVQDKGLTQISDESALVTLARDVVEANPKPVAQYRSGKTSTIQFLVGQMMKATKGQANPQTARAALEEVLGTSDTSDTSES
jgi:aspartyl-tRNA(Asn)/glutamyl-tRNA(Gln) amidotransferase subunit B